MLTKRQSTLLDFIASYVVFHKHGPSYDEMKDALGLKSKSGINRIINGLVGRGFIRHIPHRSRAIEVIRKI